MSCWVPTGSVVVITASHSLFDTPPPAATPRPKNKRTGPPPPSALQLFSFLRAKFPSLAAPFLACLARDRLPAERTVLAAVARPEEPTSEQAF